MVALACIIIFHTFAKNLINHLYEYDDSFEN